MEPYFARQSEVMCPKPRVPTNGYIVHRTQYTYPNTVEFACEEGHWLRGSKVIRCEIDGRWSHTPPRCQPVVGPFPWWGLVIIMVLVLPISVYVGIKLYMRNTGCGEGVLDKDHCEEEFDIQEIQCQSREGNNGNAKAYKATDPDDCSKPFLDDGEPEKVENLGEPPGNGTAG